MNTLLVKIHPLNNIDKHIALLYFILFQIWFLFETNFKSGEFEVKFESNFRNFVRCSLLQVKPHRHFKSNIWEC